LHNHLVRQSLSGYAFAAMTSVDGRTLRYANRRPELLGAAREYVLDHGITDLSLRATARGLGVTHATLLRHFSSKADLISEVVDSIRVDFMRRLRSDEALLGASTAVELVSRAWELLCEPAEQRQFLLLFELVGLAVREPSLGRELARSIVRDWQEPIEEALRRDGWPVDDAAALSALVVAQVRGLQLDLLLSGDRDRADRAFGLMLRLLEH
jgi:AcrR family transcriptional regulator